MNDMNIFKRKEEPQEHEVIVYRDNGVILEVTMQPLHVSHLTRWKHVFDTYTTYSWNTHFHDGMICYGMIPSPPIPFLDIKI